MPAVDVVIPTIGRDSLFGLIESLHDFPGRVFVVNDRAQELDLGPHPIALRGPGRGPAAARNIGWRSSGAEWIAFLDDDVRLGEGWIDDLFRDLTRLPARVAGSQGRVRVPLPAGRRPTDWERNVAGLETSRWITADMAFRRAALLSVRGFDERFPRAFREDADLALRLTKMGWGLVRGSRTVEHPPGPSDWWTSVRAQRGNADDMLMRALHGPDWHHQAGAPRGRRRRHLAVTAALATAVTARALRKPGVAASAAALWLAGTAEFAAARVRPGPRTASEVAKMVTTSAAIPVAAAWHSAHGWARARRAERWKPAAVIFDRDGTLVVDVPYNGDPDRVMPVPGAREALERLRAAGIATAVVTNQSGVARGMLRREQVDAVNQRVDELLGPLGPIFVCPHGPDDGCDCRKPAPGLIERAAAALGVEPDQVAVIGDIGADVEAAAAAGCVGVLVPTAATRAEEVDRAPLVAPTLAGAVAMLLGAD